MNAMKTRICAFAAATASACLLQAEVKFASPFNDGMVLQRGKTVTVWGTADAGERVTVKFAGQTISATAGADGSWRVELRPMEASFEGRVLEANGAAVRIKGNRYVLHPSNPRQKLHVSPPRRDDVLVDE
jgi:sialate O-acetylesterase